MRTPGICRHGKAKQRGAVLMIMISILVVGFAAVLVGALSFSALNSARQERTSDALTQAKEALLGYAVSDSNRPGELPCPDFNNDGVIIPADDYTGSNCKSLIGRLPWKTLRLPELRDGSGEHLWYALSDPFHASGSVILNSNTKGTLPVYNADGATLQTQAGYDAVAVIFSPGSPNGSQTRNTVAQQNDAANYLDAANSRNNATVGGPFIAGAKTDTFNDQLLFLTTKDLMPLVEQRVAGVVKQALTDYFDASGSNYYPWADSIGSTVDYAADNLLNRGWLPDVAATGPPATINWVAGSPPLWFFDNKWFTLIYYSVAKSYTANPSGCSSCATSSLVVDGTGLVRVLFFMPGTPIGTLTRAIDNLPDYLEDTANNDYPGNDSYVTPASRAADRDRLYRFTGTWTP